MVSAADDGEPCSLLGMSMGSDGHGQKSLNALYAGSGLKPEDEDNARANAAYHNIYMQGQEVFKFAVRAVPTVSREGGGRG